MFFMVFSKCFFRWGASFWEVASTLDDPKTNGGCWDVVSTGGLMGEDGGLSIA